MDQLEQANILAKHYSPLVNALLTLFLVCLTAWYAIVTRRMWREMVEARLAAIRPILDINVVEPTLSETGVKKLRTISSEVQAANFGQGPAYAVSIRVSLLYETPSEKTQIQTDVELPDTLAAGESCAASFSIPRFPTEMDSDRKDFLTLEGECRDAEGNCYLIRQSYDLRAFDLSDDLAEIISRTWQLRSEKEYFESLNAKKPLSLRRTKDLRRMDLIRSRKLPRSVDWST